MAKNNWTARAIGTFKSPARGRAGRTKDKKESPWPTSKNWRHSCENGATLSDKVGSPPFGAGAVVISHGLEKNVRRRLVSRK